jgi:hypothetical protein
MSSGFAFLRIMIAAAGLACAGATSPRSADATSPRSADATSPRSADATSPRIAGATSPRSADIPFRDRFNAALKLPALQACDRIESLLGEDLAEDDRRACVSKLRELLPGAAPLVTEDEKRLIAEIHARSQTVSETLVGRYAIVLAGKDFARNAKAAELSTWIDIAYVLERDLFGVDPVAKVGHRYVFFPDKEKPAGWSIDAASLVVSIGRDAAKLGAWDDAIAHEISHGFGRRHPARAMFGGGFFEGWGDLCAAYVCERLAFTGTPFSGRFAYYAGAFAETGKAEYLNTRLPIEEIVGYGPSSSLLVRLALLAGDGKKVPEWKPLKRYFHETNDTPPPWAPNYLWPAAMARDLYRAFGERSWEILAEYRFPFDSFTKRELEQWAERAHVDRAATRAERWKADGEVVLREWKVLGPIPDPNGRHLDFDPIDAENFELREEYAIGGRTYRWRTDVPVNNDGVVELGALEGAQEPCVFYLLGQWPPADAPPVSFSIASDDDTSVWLDGELVDCFRGNRGVQVDDPDRVYAKLKKGGGRILAEVANWGGKTGFHLRASPKNPFDYGYKVELRSPEARRRLAAVRYLGSRRNAASVVLDYLIQALDDGDASVRIAAARALGGKRNDARALSALLKRFGGEKDDGVRSALQGAISELTFQHFENGEAAFKWWHASDKEWKQGSFVECELAYSLRTIAGGWFGNNPGAYGGQCVDRGFGGDPANAFSLVLDVPQAGPRTFALRYACTHDGERVSLRVRRGEEVVIEKKDVAIPPTKADAAWSWLELSLGELASGRYHVEIVKPNGPIDCDVMGWKPTTKSAR